MQNTPFQNFAFISYRHTNGRWARWLQRKLEAYRLPATIRKSLPHQTRIRPVFRDNTDLSSGLLKDELRKELERSRFLIVLCSRDLAHKSDYVDFEIECFLEMGRAQNIIPFIIDGVPHAENPEDECFPKALLRMEDTPLGVDVQKDSRRKALIRLIAYLLGVRFDALWQRDLRKQRAKGLSAAAAAVLLLLGGLWAYDYFMPKARHYTDYALRYGIPVGIEELTASQTRESESFYTIVTSRNQVRELRHENAYGVITSEVPDYDGERPAWVKYDTYSGDALRVARYFDPYGKPLMTLRYSDFFGEDGKTQTVDFYQGYNDSVAQNMIGNLAGANASVFDSMASGANRSRIIRNIVSYTDEGFEARVLFASDTRSLTSYAADANGVYGREYEVNALGQRTRIYYLNAMGERTALPNGVNSMAVEYLGGRAARIGYLDTSDRPIRGEPGFAWETLDYDANLNNDRVSYYDAEGTLTLSSDGYARSEASFRDGLMVRYSVFDASLEPCYREGFSTQLAEYKDGLPIRIVYLDAEGNPSPNRDGHAEYRVSYDEDHRILRTESRDALGALCMNAYGYAIREYAYDEHGNLIRGQHLDPEGRPCYNSTGECLVEYEYQDDKATAVHYLDGSGRPVVNPYYGFASFLIAYTDDNASRYTYLDAEGNLCCGKDGYAEIRYKYQDGNATEVSYFGADGRPCLYEGAASQQMDYQNGRVVRSRYFDVNGAPKLNSGGYMEYRNEYDSLGRLTQQGYYGADGQPTRCSDGYGFLRYEYDAYGRKTQEAYFSAGLQPANDISGIHGIRYTYDQNGNVLSLRYINLQDSPVNKDGYTAEERAYDRRGNLIERALYQETGVTKWPVEGNQGWSVKKMAYDGRNRLISDSYFDKNGASCRDENGIHGYLYEYDARGNRTLTRYLDTDGQPMSTVGAYRAEYDEKGLVTCERWFAPDGSVASRTTYEYDARGRRVRTRYWQGEDEPTLSGGYHALQQTYDGFGHEVKAEYFGTDGQPIEIPDGYAVKITEYDEYGRPFAEEYRDSEGTLCLFQGEYARVEWNYNQQGLWAEAHFIDDKGSVSSPVAGMRWTYDNYYNTQTAYYGPNGQPVVNPKTGYAIVRYEWAGGLKVSESYFDPLGQPLEVDGVARRTWEHDEYGIIVEIACYHADGSLILENQISSKQVLITSVSPDMPGDALGLKAGDVLLALGDWRYDVSADSGAAIDALSAYIKRANGKTIPATFLRTLEDGSERVFTVYFGYGSMGVSFQDALITDVFHEHLLEVLARQTAQSGGGEEASGLAEG